MFASSAVLGLAVGFAARSTIANFVAGVMIAITQPVRLGDRVQIGDADGQVEDIGLTYTRLRTPDNRRVLIPNEELASSRVTNQTLIDSVSLARVLVTVPLSADTARVRELLAGLVLVAPGRLGDRPDPGVSRGRADRRQRRVQPRRVGGGSAARRCRRQPGCVSRRWRDSPTTACSAASRPRWSK